MALGLNLDELATRLTGADPRSAEPQAWAYALREAVALARPDVLLTGWSAHAETAALRAIADGSEDPVDALYDAPALARTEPVRRALEVVRTLAALYPGSPEVAAVLRGPSSLARALEAGDEAADVIGDLLAAVSGEYLAAGAGWIIIREDLGVVQHGPLSPILRALAHRGRKPVLIDSHGTDAAGGPDRQHRADAPDGPLLILDAALWSADEASFDAGRASIAAATGLVLVPDPLPGDMPLERLSTSP